jgi:hypothetical protein
MVIFEFRAARLILVRLQWPVHESGATLLLRKRHKTTMRLAEIGKLWLEAGEAEPHRAVPASVTGAPLAP